MNRAVLYKRVSTGGQAREGISLEAQEELARQRCAASGWQLVEVYEDVMSGRKDARPGLARLMKDAEVNRFDVVLVYRLDRLGRSQVKTLQVVGELADLGVRLVSLTQPFDIDGSLGKLIISIYASFSEMESEAIGARVRDARRHLVSTNGKHYAVPPYGYLRTDDGATVPNPETADRVRWFFEEVANGRGLRSIVVEMNEAGVRTGTGGIWSITGLRVILTNPAYLGKITHGRKLLTRTSKGAVRRTILPHGSYLLADGQHEALVDEATWHRVQQQIESRRKLAPRKSGAVDKHPWLAVAKCGECGGYIGVHEKRGYAQYFCGRQGTSGQKSCPLRSISGRILAGVLVREMAGPLSGEVKAPRPKKPKQDKAERDRKNEVTRLEAAIQKEADLYRAGAQGLPETERRVKELRTRLQELAVPEAITQLAPPKIEDVVEFWRELSAPERAGFLRALVQRVTIHSDRLRLEWRPEYHEHLGEGFEVARPTLRGPQVKALALD